jgi:Flp pilus assembly protein TadG
MRACRDKRGTSAIEFALVAPLLAAATIGMADVNTMAYGAANMQTAVRAGVQFAIAGGTDLIEAEKRADAAWTRKPEGGTISAARVCKCEMANWDCDTPCDTNLQVFVTVSATATLGGFVYSMNKTTTETVRIR